MVPVKITEMPLSKLVNNIKSFNRFYVKDLSISVLEISNPAGSAKMAETEESTSTIYLGISEVDTDPEQIAFCIKDLYAVSNIKFDSSFQGEARISFTYVDISNKTPVKKDIILRLTLKGVTIVSP